MGEELIKKSINSIIGKPLFAEKNLIHHDRFNSIGVIDEAGVTGDLVWIKGSLFSWHSICLSLSASEEILGVSFDAENARIVDMRKSIWELQHIEFVGATVILQKHAAYRQDCLFWLE
jgi:hypothetical protein